MIPARLNKVIPYLVLVTFLTFSSLPAARAECRRLHEDAQSLSIVVNGSPHQVFQAIKQSRYQEPGRRKVVASDSSSAILEESFKNLPIVGDAICRYKETEILNERIDYQIMNSDKFKAFDGAWELEPLDGGKATRLKLSSYVESYLKVPFWKQLTAMNTKRDIKRRLNNIKQNVESRRTSEASIVKL